MAGIFGKLGLADTDRVFNATVGQQAIYDAAVEYVNKVNAEIDRALSCFVAETTSDYKRRFKLPGGGHLSRRGPDGRFGAAKAYGSWDVAPSAACSMGVSLLLPMLTPTLAPPRRIFN